MVDLCLDEYGNVIVINVAGRLNPMTKGYALGLNLHLAICIAFRALNIVIED